VLLFGPSIFRLCNCNKSHLLVKEFTSVSWVISGIRLLVTHTCARIATQVRVGGRCYWGDICKLTVNRTSARRGILDPHSGHKYQQSHYAIPGEIIICVN